MPRDIHVFQASLADAALLAGLHAVSFDGAMREHGSRQHVWDEDAMAHFIAGPGTLCLIGCSADVDSTPSGLLIARRAADEAELLTIGVAPEWRRLGVGQTLLQHAVAILRASGTARLFLEVDETNAGAVELYRGFGAAPVGRRPRYYENGADAAIFCLALSAPHSDDAQNAL